MPDENHYVKASFTIKRNTGSIEKTNLFIQAGNQGISFAEFNTDEQKFVALQFYSFPPGISITTLATDIESIFVEENLLQQNFKKIFITWCFNESILIPYEYFEASTAGEMLTLVYGNSNTGTSQQEMVMGQNLHTVYKIPAEIKSVFNNHFPFAIQTHQNSLLINVEKQYRDILYCCFYPSHITVMLRKNGQLQIIQNFEYHIPEDVVYHLLNICQNFELDPSRPTLLLSGLIDEDSILYKELYKYFLQLEFAKLPGQFSYTDEIKNYPSHYFSNLFATAACVL